MASMSGITLSEHSLGGAFAAARAEGRGALVVYTTSGHPDPERGLAVMERVGCAACHDIPGIAWPKGAVGGPLEGFASRPLIAGRLPNQPGTLARFVQNAPSLAPETGMPAMPITQAEARDIAAYLYTLDGG